MGAAAGDGAGSRMDEDTPDLSHTHRDLAVLLALALHREGNGKRANGNGRSGVPWREAFTALLGLAIVGVSWWLGQFSIETRTEMRVMRSIQDQRGAVIGQIEPLHRNGG